MFSVKYKLRKRARKVVQDTMDKGNKKEPLSTPEITVTFKMTKSLGGNRKGDKNGSSTVYQTSLRK